MLIIYNSYTPYINTTHILLTSLPPLLPQNAPLSYYFIQKDNKKKLVNELSWQYYEWKKYLLSFQLWLVSCCISCWWQLVGWYLWNKEILYNSRRAVSRSTQCFTCCWYGTEPPGDQHQLNNNDTIFQLRKISNKYSSSKSGRHLRLQDFDHEIL